MLGPYGAGVLVVEAGLPLLGGAGPLHPHLYIHYLGASPLDVNGGCGGKEALASGSPRSCTAKIDFWYRAPSRGPVTHEDLQVPLAPGKLNDVNTNRIQGSRTLWLCQRVLYKSSVTGLARNT